jgi:hypothetical protein
VRATADRVGDEVAVRVVLSTASPAAEAAGESLVASAHALESVVMAATQRLADLQRAQERTNRELGESVQALRRQTEVLGAWRARLASHVAAWGLILPLLTGTGIALARRAREVAFRRKKLRDRLPEAGSERFSGPAAERVTVDQLADAPLVRMENQRRASADKIRSHLKPLRPFFAHRPAIDVTTASLERYQRERLDTGKAPATVNREVARA